MREEGCVAGKLDESARSRRVQLLQKRSERAVGRRDAVVSERVVACVYRERLERDGLCRVMNDVVPRRCSRAYKKLESSTALTL